jgi:hypothetical protein
VLKKTIKYENVDGEQVTEDFYFHLTKAEIIETFMAGDANDMESRLKRIIETNDSRAIMAEFKKIIGITVGYRTANGKFVKTPEYAQEFLSSEAYSELFLELMSETGKAVEFINGLVPAQLRDEVSKQMANQGSATVVELPNSGVIEGVQGDAEVQAAKPQPNWQEAGVSLPQPTPFPQTTEAAIVANQQAAQPSTDEEPLWYQQNRYPTKKELMAMGNDEMQFAMKLKNAHAFG